MFLIHVKTGFGNTMRDLCSQISIAANRIIEDKNAGWEYVGKVYDSLLSKKGSDNSYFSNSGRQTILIPKEEFCKILEIIYLRDHFFNFAKFRITRAIPGLN